MQLKVQLDIYYAITLWTGHNCLKNNLQVDFGDTATLITNHGIFKRFWMSDKPECESNILLILC